MATGPRPAAAIGPVVASRPQEQLEDRTVPVVANFDFEMPARIMPDSAGRCDLHTPSYVKPRGFAVKLDATPTIGDVPATDQYAWPIKDASGTVIRNLDGLEPQTNLEEGFYNVSLTVTSGNTSSTTSRDIVIDNLLIVAMGDSFFSGRGRRSYLRSSSKIQTST
jgi:hypothetical protein